MAIYGYVRPYVPAHPSGLRVVFIGDSKMRGAVYDPTSPYAVSGFVYHGGPRPVPYAAVKAVDPAADFIGHVLNTSENPDVTDAGSSHSGVNGTSGVNWYGSYWDSLKGNWTGAHIFCIAVGANDGNTAPIATDFCRLMDKAAVDFPKAVVLFGTESGSDVPGSYATQAAQVRLEVAARKSYGMNVDLVDVHAEAGLVVGQDWSDGLHLTDSGYAKVGAVWAKALMRRLGAA